MENQMETIRKLYEKSFTEDVERVIDIATTERISMEKACDLVLNERGYVGEGYNMVRARMKRRILKDIMSRKNRAIEGSLEMMREAREDEVPIH